MIRITAKQRRLATQLEKDTGITYPQAVTMVLEAERVGSSTEPLPSGSRSCSSCREVYDTDDAFMVMTRMTQRGICVNCYRSKV